MKKLLILLLVLTMILCGCAEKKAKISEKEAISIAVEHLQKSGSQPGGVHVHAGTVNGEECYSIYITVGEKTMQYVINAYTGEIVKFGESSHAH